jgi:hypothetical protein
VAFVSSIRALRGVVAVVAAAAAAWAHPANAQGIDCGEAVACDSDPCGAIGCDDGGCGCQPLEGRLLAPSLRSGSSFWIGGGALLWTIDGPDALPPLVTASPAGTPTNQIGVLGEPGTTTVLGGDDTTDAWRAGWRLNAGVWLDRCQTWAVVGDFFDLDGDDDQGISPTSTTALTARPFFNSELGEQDAQLLNDPGRSAGTVGARSDDDFRGAGLGLRRNLTSCCLCEPCGGMRWSETYADAGYRHYRYGSELAIDEAVVILPNTTTPLVPGTLIALRDSFHTDNDFHGGELGFGGRFGRGCWFFDGSAHLAIGNTRRRVTIDGSTLTAVPGGGTARQSGALLTSSATNIGRFESNETGVIPRLRLAGGARLTDRWSASVGYNALVWDGVLAASGQLPPGLAVDPRNIPPVQAGGGPHPALRPDADDTIVVHGFDFSLTYAY